MKCIENFEGEGAPWTCNSWGKTPETKQLDVTERRAGRLGTCAVLDINFMNAWNINNDEIFLHRAWVWAMNVGMTKLNDKTKLLQCCVIIKCASPDLKGGQMGRCRDGKRVLTQSTCTLKFFGRLYSYSLSTGPSCTCTLRVHTLLPKSCTRTLRVHTLILSEYVLSYSHTGVWLYVTGLVTCVTKYICSHCNPYTLRVSVYMHCSLVFSDMLYLPCSIKPMLSDKLSPLLQPKTLYRSRVPQHVHNWTRAVWKIEICRNEWNDKALIDRAVDNTKGQ